MPTMEVWMTSPFVETKVEFEETEDIDVDDNLIAWFDVKFALPESDEEKKERTEAIKAQMQAGVLTKHGVPHGMEIPKELQEKIDMQLKHKQKNSIENLNFNSHDKPKIKNVKGRKQVVLSPLASRIEQQIRNSRKKKGKR
jgi:hypothetical protein